MYVHQFIKPHMQHANLAHEGQVKATPAETFHASNVSLASPTISPDEISIILTA
jgi:hypothetical protein